MLRDGGPVCVCAHASPDGDALGSLLGLGLLARGDRPRRRALPGRRRAVSARAGLPAARRASQRRVPADAAAAHADRARLRLGAAHRSPRRGRRAVRARRQHRPPPRQHALRHHQPGRRRGLVHGRDRRRAAGRGGHPAGRGRARSRSTSASSPTPGASSTSTRRRARTASRRGCWRRACSRRRCSRRSSSRCRSRASACSGWRSGAREVAAGGRLAVTSLARDDFDVDGRRRRRPPTGSSMRCGRSRESSWPRSCASRAIAAGPARKVSLRSRAGGARLLGDRARAGRRRAPRRGRVLDGRDGRGDRGLPGAGGRRVNAAVLLVDKPAGPTSFGCVARVRGALGGRRVKVGHAGTLDPFATGLLALLVGRATRLAPYLVGLDKRYRAVVQFGVRSDTGDPEGVLEPGEGAAARRRRARARLRRARRADRAGASRHLRDQGRRPARLCARARRARRSRCRRARCIVHALDVVSHDAASGRAVLDIHCSKGTYVRALARDLGEALGCGAYCAELRRLAIGHLDVANAGSLDDVAARSARRAAGACAAATRSRTCPRASSSRPSATRCCTAARSRRAARTARCAASPRDGSCASPRRAASELRPLVVVDEE